MDESPCILGASGLAALPGGVRIYGILFPPIKPL